jgi:hypothetical protein
VSANIVLFTINNPKVRYVPLQYVVWIEPSGKVKNKNHLSATRKKLNIIEVLCRKENIWMSTDKTTNGSGRKTAKVISGVFKSDQMLSDK